MWNVETLGRSVFRGRPAVIIGWLREWLRGNAGKAAKKVK